jgi:ATP-binding cassette subfamily C exporter for protease/lipase
MSTTSLNERQPDRRSKDAALTSQVGRHPASDLISENPALDSNGGKNPGTASAPSLRATLWSFRREFLVVGLLSAIANLLLLVPAIYMMQIFDRVMLSGNQLTLLMISLLVLILLGFMSLSEWTRSRILVLTGMRLDEKLSTRVFNSSFEASLDHTGQAPAKAFSDLVLLRQFITGNGLFALFDAPWSPIYIIVIFLLQPMLGWVAIVFACIQVLLAWFGQRRTVAPAEQAIQAQGDTNVYLQGKLRNSEVIESMGMVGNLLGRWRLRHRKALDAASHSYAVNTRVSAVSKFVRYSQQSLGLGAGALLVIHGELSPGAMIAANLLMNRALTPLDQLSQALRGFKTARSAFERLEKLLRDYPERDARLGRVAPQGALQLQGLVASARGRETPILKGIDLEIAPGSVTVVLGPSGSGKSTLARCIVGIWPDVSGEVLLDERPLSGWNRVELGPHIGYLPQDIELFDGSIAENIARFTEVDSERVIAAAKLCGLHDMILRFPKGYDTPMGEAGSLLSGGQRQRVALARAVYGEPKVVVLDEPNANLDDAGEAALAATVAQLKTNGSTVVVVSHRPNAIALADSLVLLQDGQIAVSGPRDAVLGYLREQQAKAQAAQATQAPK